MRESLFSTGLLLVCFYNPSGKKWEGEPETPRTHENYDFLWYVLVLLCAAAFLLFAYMHLYMATHPYMQLEGLWWLYASEAFFVTVGWFCWYMRKESHRDKTECVVKRAVLFTIRHASR